MQRNDDADYVKTFARLVVGDGWCRQAEENWHNTVSADMRLLYPRDTNDQNKWTAIAASGKPF